MEQKIYVDVLICINFIIDYIILFCMCKLCGRSIKRLRLCMSALVGAAFSLMIFLPALPMPKDIIVKLLICITMVYMCNPIQSKKQFLKELFVFFTINFFLAGVVLAIWVTVTPPNMVYNNSVIYFNMSPLMLIINIGIAYVIISIFNKYIKNSIIEKGIYNVTVCIFEQKKIFKGYVDTGNSLKDPFTQIPAIVCGFKDVVDVLPKDFLEVYLKDKNISSENIDSLKNETRKLLRLIPYADVSNMGTLPAFKVDYMEIVSRGELIMVENAYLAVSKKDIGDGNYNLLLSPQLVEIKKGIVGVLK